jgi:predicted DNA-binding transcriptional regulator YafY
MSTRDSLTRHTLLINKLRKRPASKKEIDAYLAQEEELQGYKLRVSNKTFRRDLDSILSLYHIDIQYHFSKKVYYIHSDSQSEASARLFEAFDAFNAINITEGFSKYVHFEKRRPKGTENLYGLLHAIKNKLKITFAFQDFWEDEVKRRVAEPFALKEFKNRWYILAKDLSDSKIKRFALDRLTELEITKKPFDSKAEYNVEEIYRDCFGIITSDESKPCEIILTFEAYQGKYINSLPLHDSQQVISDTDEELQIKLRLHITHDFIMELLSFGETVTVIKPPELKVQMENTLRKALDNYA